jgi:hypothetical protein
VRRHVDTSQEPLGFVAEPPQNENDLRGRMASDPWVNASKVKSDGLEDFQRMPTCRRLDKKANSYDVD